MGKLRVGILGATGIVGQNYMKLLENHPWFEVTYLVASEKSSGKTFDEATEDRNFFDIDNNLKIHSLENIANAKSSCDFVFSALDTKIAQVHEPLYAKYLPVISNSSAYRNADDVPMIIAEVNSEHTDIIPMQKKSRGWDGFIVVKPNCSLQSYMTPLAVLKDYGLKNIIITTMQSVSGAGHPGVSSFDIIDNIIPYINGEEEKSENEPLKILGRVSDNKIVPARGVKLSAHCNRVPTIDGHMACVSVEFKIRPEIDDILKIWKNFESIPYKLGLPSAPKNVIIYKDEPNRPQTRLDRDNENGMAVTVGRLRECNVLAYRFVGLSHNTVRGAAGGGILNAELLKAKGYL